MENQLTLETLSDEYVGAFIYGLSARIQHGLSNKKTYSHAVKTLKKCKKIAQEREIDAWRHEVLPLEQILSKENYDAIVDTYAGDSKSAEKEACTRVVIPLATLIREKVWGKNCIVKIGTELWKYDDECDIKLLCLGAQVTGDDESLTVIDHVNAMGDIERYLDGRFFDIDIKIFPTAALHMEN